MGSREEEGEGGGRGEGTLRPESPMPQALGAGGRERGVKGEVKSEQGVQGWEQQQQQQQQQGQEEERQQKKRNRKKRKRKWSLFGRKRRSSFKSLPPSLPPRPSSSASDLDNELDEILSVDVLAKRLIQLLKTRPEALLKIYRKSEMLEKWRMEVQLDLGMEGREKEKERRIERRLDGSGSAWENEEVIGGGTDGGIPSFHMEHSVSTIFADQMELVGSLTDRIKQTVMSHVSDAFRLSLTTPRLLEQALTVVKLHRDFNKEKLDVARQKMERAGTKSLDWVLRLCGIEDWDGEVRLVLKEAAALRALEVFTVAHLEAAAAMDEGGKEGLSREAAMIGAAECLLEDLKEVLGRIPKFFGEEHKARHLIRGQYDAHLMRQVAGLHRHGLSDVEIGDLFEINRFLLKYQREVVLLGAEAPSAEVKVAAQACLQECLVKTRQQMGRWYEAILGRRSEVLFDADGRPFTANPEDLFQIVHTQVRRRGGRREGGR